MTVKRSYQQEDTFRFKHVVDAVLSRTGSFCIYQLSELAPGRGPEEDRQASSLWRIDLAGGAPRRMTAKGRDAASPQVTPDERSVLYLAGGDGADGARQIYRLPLDGGAAETITSLEQGVASFSLSPDGKWIAFAAMGAPLVSRGGNGHVRINRLAYRFDSVPGYLHDVAQAIYLMAAEGGAPRAVTRHDGLVTAMAWSPDSNNVAAMILGKADRITTPAIQELCVVDRAGGVDKLIDLMGFFGRLFWTRDGERIGCCTFSVEDAGQPQLQLIDRNGGRAVCRTASLELSVGNFVVANNPGVLAKHRFVVSEDDADVICPVGRGGELNLCRISLSGMESCRPVISGPRTCIALDSSAETLLFAAQDFVKPSELYILDLRTGEERALTDHNSAACARIAWPEIEHVVARSDPTVAVEGWVWKPSRSKGPMKTILCIHGGPQGAYGYAFNEDFHELVGAGYAVAFANPRGSTGYGDEFSKSIVGRWGDAELEDLNAFLDEVIARGIADPDNLGVTGISVGGYLTAWLIGHSNRFKAAIPEQGLYNLFSMYGSSDAAGLDWLAGEMGGHPHQAVQRYWEHSPIAYAHSCRTPTLLIQGEDDVRCPMAEAEQLFAVLKHNGCEAELLRLKNCSHTLEIYGPPPLRRARMDAIKDWFGRHLREGLRENEAPLAADRRLKGAGDQRHR